MPGVAPARLPESSFRPVAAAARADASSVITPMATVAVARAAKRPRSTQRRDCGVVSTRSRRPSCSSAAQRLTWVTAKAISKSGRSTNIALRKLALRFASPPPRFLMRVDAVGELAKSVENLASICCTTTTIQAAKPDAKGPPDGGSDDHAKAPCIHRVQRPVSDRQGSVHPVLRHPQPAWQGDRISDVPAAEEPDRGSAQDQGEGAEEDHRADAGPGPDLGDGKRGDAADDSDGVDRDHVGVPGERGGQADELLPRLRRCMKAWIKTTLRLLPVEYWRNFRLVSSSKRWTSCSR